MSSAAPGAHGPAAPEDACPHCGAAQRPGAKFCPACGRAIDQMKDFFISYTGVDVGWAEWIAQQVEAAGFTTIYQKRDFGAGVSFVIQMDRAMRQTKRTIAVLSPAYLEARFTLIEWAEAFRRDPTGEHALLAPVRVKACEVAGVLGTIVYIDLVGLDAPKASARLVEQVRRLSSKPLPPPTPVAFPGTAPVAERVIAPQGMPRALSLVGRADALADLMAQLRAGDTVGVFALEGMGGIGKTALAAEVVARLAEARERPAGARMPEPGSGKRFGPEAEDQAAFPGGAAWIACEGLEGETGLAEVWARVARALGLEQAATLPDPAARRAALGAALSQQKRLLLALDNIEPGLDADALLDTLAVRGHTALLLTARHKVAPLRLRAMELAPLPPPDGADLFRERLRQIDAARPTAQDEPSISRLLAAVGGLPLAIELTAAYAGMQRLALETMLREVEHDGLNAAAFRVDPKKALLTRFERSWLALARRQQQFFAGLALLAEGSFPREAALALAEATDDQTDPQGDLLTLVSYALVEALPGGERLRLHPLLREYAAGKLKALPQAQQERLGDAMVAFWLAYARAHPGYEGMDALEAEAAGLIGILAWACEHARHLDLLRLAHALRLAWKMRGRRNEQLRIYVWAVEAAKALDDLGWMHWALHQLATTQASLGLVEEAWQGLEQALGLALQSGNLPGEQATLHELSRLAYETGRLEEARLGFVEALELARQLGSLADEQTELHSLALLDGRMGRWDEARQGFEKALELARQLRDPMLEALELVNLGYLLCLHSQIEQGRVMIEQSLTISKLLSDVYSIGKCHEFLGTVDEWKSNHTGAVAHYREALRCLKQVQSPDAEDVRASLRKLGAGEDQANT